MLNQGLIELPAPLRSRIIAEPKVLRFNLEGCAVDALELLKLADDWGRLEVISPHQAATARRVIGASRGTFLPEFESVDNLVTSGRPTCTELIKNLRDKLTDRRARLLGGQRPRRYVAKAIAGHRLQRSAARVEQANEAEVVRARRHGLNEDLVHRAVEILGAQHELADLVEQGELTVARLQFAQRLGLTLRPARNARLAVASPRQ